MKGKAALKRISLVKIDSLQKLARSSLYKKKGERPVMFAGKGVDGEFVFPGEGGGGKNRHSQRPPHVKKERADAEEGKQGASARPTIYWSEKKKKCIRGNETSDHLSSKTKR